MTTQQNWLKKKVRRKKDPRGISKNILRSGRNNPQSLTLILRFQGKKSRPNTLTVIKKATILIIILSQKSSIGFGNLHASD